MLHGHLCRKNRGMFTRIPAKAQRGHGQERRVSPNAQVTSRIMTSAQMQDMATDFEEHERGELSPLQDLLMEHEGHQQPVEN